MRRYRSWGTAPLLSTLLMVVLHSFALHSAAARTRESLLYCLPAETEPHGLIRCVIQVLDGYQQPTTNFDPSDFIALTRTSNATAVVTKSALVRGSDNATVVFTLSVSTAADVLIRVYLRENDVIGGNAGMGEVRGSGITVSVLSWPTSRLGPITCTAQSTGLALRSATICRAALYDKSNTPSVVHSADVLFSEASALGNFVFTSGIKELVFSFTAPPTAPALVGTFTLTVSLRGKDAHVNSDGAQAVQIPILYPGEVALSETTGLQCAAETRPITCFITASGAQGPVTFNATHFRLRVERSVGAVAAAADTLGRLTTNGSGAATRHWVDVTDTFSLSVTRSPLRPYVGVVSWEPKLEDSMYEARLRVFASTDGQEVGAASRDSAAATGNAADVAGSPYSFMTGILPNAPSVTLRGCRESVIASGNTTVCFIDLANGVSGDTAFYAITTSHRESSVSNLTYVAHDAVCACRSLWFTYHAPTALISPVDDYIEVSMYTDVVHSVSGMAIASNVPLRLDVLPVVSRSGHDTSTAPTDAVLVSVGILFYGSVLAVGGVLIVHRSRKAARIRRKRALKERAMMQAMDRRQGVPTPDAEILRDNPSALTETPAMTTTLDGAAAGHVFLVRGGGTLLLGSTSLGAIAVNPPLPTVTGARGECATNSAACVSGAALTISSTNFNYRDHAYQQFFVGVTEARRSAVRLTPTAVSMTDLTANLTVAHGTPAGSYPVFVKVQVCMMHMMSPPRYVGNLVLQAGSASRLDGDATRSAVGVSNAAVAPLQRTSVRDGDAFKAALVFEVFFDGAGVSRGATTSVLSIMTAAWASVGHMTSE
ncbi:putative integral membrane protein [Leishmania donovani]|uniref:Putative integral membrane protein n=1 Tax=Leishmania donovani TaxID=5661 RepID=A0A504YD13_LEIDO|nr:putative integral membrane protein [Leishmania donovani]